MILCLSEAIRYRSESIDFIPPEGGGLILLGRVSWWLLRLRVAIMDGISEGLGIKPIVRNTIRQRSWVGVCIALRLRWLEMENLKNGWNVYFRG